MKIHKIGIVLLLFALFHTACSDKEVANDKGMDVSDENSTEEAGHLYGTLHEYMDKGILLGHQDALVYGSMWYGESGRSDMKSACNNLPAVYGWDLGRIETGSSFNIDSVFFADISKYIVDVNARKGISVVSWHANNPVTGDDYDAPSGNNPVAAILPGGKNHAQYLQYLDSVAAFFLQLKDESGAYIPLIFRPFHDYNNPALWWGNSACSPEEYKELWKTTVDYLRNKKQIHHVLYAYSVYSPTEKNSITETYPGDSYVDIIGIDLFLNLQDDPEGIIYKENLDEALSAVTNFSKAHNKIPAITCTGLAGIRISNYFTNLVYPVISKYNLSYILFWRNSWNLEDHYFIPIPGHPANDNFIEFVNKERILTLEKL